MQKNISKEERLKRLQKLPEDVQDIFLSQETADLYSSIVERYNLRIDQAKELSDETNLLLLGITPHNEFVQNLKTRLPNIDQETLNAIVHDIDTQLFSPIRESLKTKPQEDTPTHTTHVPAQPPKPQVHVDIPEDGTLPKKPPTTTGIERTMPQDVLEAKLRSTIHSPLEKKEVPSENKQRSDLYKGNDPYREPLE